MSRLVEESVSGPLSTEMDSFGPFFAVYTVDILVSQRFYNRTVRFIEISFPPMINLENLGSFYTSCSDNLMGIFSLEHAFIDKRSLGTGLHHEAKYGAIVLLVVL
jgi:hypothetical protein